MNELPISSIKTISLDILKDVHDFCTKNGIHYSLAFGTLLGAVRHKGFIPWDDDVDIMLPREDYKKLCSTYKSDRFVLSSMDRSPDCMIPYARIYDNVDTFSKSRQPWLVNHNPVGVWIDVFPIDIVPAKLEDFDKAYRKLLKIFLKSCHSRGALSKISSQYSFRDNLSIIAKKAIYLGGGVSPKLFNNKILRIASDWAKTDSKKCSVITCPLYPANKVHFNLNWFNEFIQIEFEDTTFMTIKDYDEFLTCVYGDYMTPPPEDKRARHHSFVHFYQIEK